MLLGKAVEAVSLVHPVRPEVGEKTGEVHGMIISE